MDANLNWIANFIWGIADDVLRDLYVRGRNRDVILPMTVLRRLDAVLDANNKCWCSGSSSIWIASIKEIGRSTLAGMNRPRTT